jgi:CheY-like chemotaxis protein
MSTDMVKTLLDAASGIAWPVLVAVVVWRLFPTLRKILESRAFIVKVGSTEVSVQDASDQLRAQVADLQNQLAAVRQSGSGVDKEGVAASTESVHLQEPPETILWVDDQPKNNAYEVAKFESDGYRVVQVRSTDEAMEFLSKVDERVVVISDMARREAGRYEREAGVMLVKAMRDAGIEAPFFVYTSSQTALRENEAVKAAGGNGATASPLDLYELVGMTRC